MSREVRRVPPNWEHPRYTDEDAPSAEWIGEYRPCYDQDYQSAAEAWCAEFDDWRRGQHPCQIEGIRYFWEYESPPDEETCRPAFSDDPTWFQIYETVSEGTPVSPPFATLDGLARWLADNGDFAEQHRCHKHGEPLRKPTYEQALAFLTAGWAPSLVVINSPAGCKILGPYEEAEHDIRKQKEDDDA